MQRAYRLRRPAEFQRVRAGRRSWGHPLLVLYAAPNDGQPTRVGISVGKRVGKAVVRNKIRRRIGEAVRLRYAELAPGHDLVFIARAPAADADWSTIRGATEDLLHRARVLPREGGDGGDLGPHMAGSADGVPALGTSGRTAAPSRPTAAPIMSERAMRGRTNA